MKKIKFTKMVASGNDFIVIRSMDSRSVKQLKKLAQKFCDRKYGVGADGLLVLDKSPIADMKMRIFNADGSEAEMCGNGARCIALWASLKSSFASGKMKSQKRKTLKIETKAGIINLEADRDNARIKLTDPKEIKLDNSIKLNGRRLKVNLIDTGVPHAVIFVEGLERIDVLNMGRQIRYHRKFAPRGINVDFVEVLDNNTIKIRTYERGVEAETLACGTGAVASALIYVIRSSSPHLSKINVVTEGKEVLKVYFINKANKFNNVLLEGKVTVVCQGEYYV